MGTPNSLHKMVIKFAVLLAILSHATSSQAGLGDDEPFSERNCTCYSKSDSFSCHCEGKVHVHADGLHAVNITLVCADGGDAVDPYRFLSLVDLEHVQSVALNVTGCPPPGRRGYSSLPVRKGDKMADLGAAVPNVKLLLDCGNLGAFRLEGHHFSNFENLTSLSMDCPPLAHVPEGLLAAISETAVSVRLRNTALVSVQDGVFSRFKRLESLSLTGNRLESCGFIRGLRTLRDLDLKGNGIDALPDDGFDETRDVVRLDVSRNLLAGLPRSLCGLERLEQLDARNNLIEFVGEGCFASLTSLKVLSMQGNRLRTLDSLVVLSGAVYSSDQLVAEGSESIATSEPPPNSDSTQGSKPTRDTGDEPPTISFEWSIPESYSTLLDFSENALESLREDAFHNFPNLTELNLSFNRLISVPPETFRRNRFLRTLRLSDNLLSSLPEALLSDCPSLQHLDLSSNRISTLGARFFSGVPDLTRLRLSDNHLETLPDDVFRPFAGARGSGRPLVLDLEGNRLVDLPHLGIKRLTELNVARNRLSHLPPDTLNETLSLRRVNFSFNHIRNFENSSTNFHHVITGSGLFHSGLNQLHSVDLSHNSLTIFPRIKFVEGSLRFLNLSWNQIRVLEPQSLYPHVAVMEVLDLSNNNLISVLNDDKYPSSWGSSDVVAWDLREMKMLRRVDLSWNGIALGGCLDNHLLRRFVSCDTFLGSLTKLEVILLAHNEIEVVPVNFEILPKLRFVDLRYNRIKRISHEHLFFVGGLTKRQLDELGDSEHNYVRRNPSYFELPNSHSLTVDLRHNEIASVELPDGKIRVVLKSFRAERHFSRATLLLGENPFVCSCQVFKLLRYAQREIRPVSEDEAWEGLTYVLPVKVDVQDLSCWEPVSMRGKNLSNPETWAHHLLPLKGLCHVLEYP